MTDISDRLKAAGVRVRSLTWGGWGAHWTAYCLSGCYEISETGGRWRVSFRGAHSNFRLKDCDSLEAAKATAEADYQASILAALETIQEVA